MIRARLAWAAFKNMMRAAARDPIWAFVNLIGMPFRIWKPLLQTFFILFLVLFIVGLGGRFVLGVGSGWGRNDTLSRCFLGPEIFAGQ